MVYLTDNLEDFNNENLFDFRTISFFTFLLAFFFLFVYFFFFLSCALMLIYVFTKFIPSGDPKYIIKKKKIDDMLPLLRKEMRTSNFFSFLLTKSGKNKMGIIIFLKVAEKPSIYNRNKSY